MPTTYAHWHFGQECIETMPDHFKKIISQHRDFFDIGVHGPDIFFYDLMHKDLPAFGARMHSEAAKGFFENCCKVYIENNEKDEMLAYILGFLSHFTLDSQCHGYIDRKKEVSGISHNKIESEYDGHLIRLDGKKVNLTDRSESLKPDKNKARIIAYFMPYDQKAILRTTRAHRFIISFLNCVSENKRHILEFLFTKLNMSNYKDLLVGNEEMEECRDSNLRLDKLKANALKIYPKLMNNLLDHINKNTRLNRYFDHNYEPWEDYKEIPILSYEEELEYKIQQ